MSLYELSKHSEVFHKCDKYELYSISAVLYDCISLLIDFIKIFLVLVV